MHKLLIDTFEALEYNNISYCILRDGDRLEQYDNGGEIDLLISKKQLPQLQTLLGRYGFVKLLAWGHSPHHFFIAYHKMSDCWLKLDVVTEIAYGRPAHTLQTKLADNCLKQRRRFGSVFIPAPEDEFITLLLHCVLDKDTIAPHRGARLQALAHQIRDETYLNSLLAQYWTPGTNWLAVKRQVLDANWQGLYSQNKAIKKNLTERAPLTTIGRRIRDRLLRKVQRGVGYLLPQTPSVALMAPDGAGKSTLAQGIGENFYFPVRLVYMGLYQNGTVRRDKKVKGVGLLNNLLTQWWRYLTSRHYRAGGKMVVFDRYSYDALLPSPTPSRKSTIRRWLLAHSCPPPDLILFLDAPGEMLYARKGERTPVALEEQRQQYLQMRSTLPQMVVVDATQGSERVRQEVTEIIWQKYARQFA